MQSTKAQPTKWRARMHCAQEMCAFFFSVANSRDVRLQNIFLTAGCSLKLAMRHQALWDAEALSSSHPSEILFPWPQNVIWALALVEPRFPKQKAGEMVKYKGVGKQIHLQIPGTDLITHRIRQGSFGERGQHPRKTNSAGFAKLLFCYTQLNCRVLL